jgi:hypothetical protein
MVAWCVFWLVIVLAVVQFVLVLLQSISARVTRHPSDELKGFSLRISRSCSATSHLCATRRPFPSARFPQCLRRNPKPNYPWRGKSPLRVLAAELGQTSGRGFGRDAFRNDMDVAPSSLSDLTHQRNIHRIRPLI